MASVLGCGRARSRRRDLRCIDTTTFKPWGVFPPRRQSAPELGLRMGGSSPGRRRRTPPHQTSLPLLEGLRQLVPVNHGCQEPLVVFAERSQEEHCCCHWVVLPGRSGTQLANSETQIVWCHYVIRQKPAHRVRALSPDQHPAAGQPRRDPPHRRQGIARAHRRSWLNRDPADYCVSDGKVYGAWARRELALKGELTEQRRRMNVPPPEPSPI